MVLRGRLPVVRAVLTILLESAWEIIENTDRVIDKYREATISLDYSGDSIVNSLADIAACALGYGLAASLPLWASAAGFLAVEGLLVLWIRDSLLLNLLMLFYPIEAIKNWQIGGFGWHHWF